MKINRPGPSWTCSPRCYKWPSATVVLRKSHGDELINGDYKIGVNYRVCSDSYPIPNVVIVFHALADMSVFTKID